MDKIIINDLTVETKVGAYQWEAHVKQKLTLNLEIVTDAKPAAQTDDLTKALDYAAITDCITKFCDDNHFKLLETLAEKIAELIFTKFKTSWLKLQIFKPGIIANVKTVGIEIERTVT